MADSRQAPSSVSDTESSAFSVAEAWERYTEPMISDLANLSR
jgi:hypothetical protein